MVGHNCRPLDSLVVFAVSVNAPHVLSASSNVVLLANVLLTVNLTISIPGSERVTVGVDVLLYRPAIFVAVDN